MPAYGRGSRPCARQSSGHRLARVRETHRRKQPPERVGDVRDPVACRHDRPAELALLADEQVRAPLRDDWHQVGQHRLGTARAEDKVEQAVGALPRGEGGDLGRRMAQRRRVELEDAGGPYVKALVAQLRTDFGGARPAHLVARVFQRAGEREHRLEVAASRCGREKHPHALTPSVSLLSFVDARL